MWKDYLKKLVPALRHRPTVLRLHHVADALRGTPARVRLAFMGRARIHAANIARRDKRVVFVSDNPLRREPKFAYALKRAGWEVILLHKASPRKMDYSDYVDVQTYNSSWEAVALAHKTRARVFHNFSPSYDDTTVNLIENKPGRVIVDFYDYFHALSAGMPVRKNFVLEIAHQRRCIDLADAVCTPDLQLQYDRRETRIARGKPLICFPNYCWDRIALPEGRAPGPTRIVQIGWLEFGKDVGSRRVTREFLAAGCEFHIYLHPQVPPQESADFRLRFREYLALQEEFPGLHFHASVPSHALPQELTQYDYGFNMIDGSTYGATWEKHNPSWLPLLASGRIFDYLDAGLPTLCDGNLAFNRHLFGRTAFIDGTALVRSGAIREALATRPDRQTMREARARLSADRNIHRLTKFYETL